MHIYICAKDICVGVLVSDNIWPSDLWCILLLPNFVRSSIEGPALYINLNNFSLKKLGKEFGSKHVQ